jgi:type IV secretory pathway VirB2 component (pilin)
MSILVGVLAVIGIVIVGIQYMTAGGNEEQTRKAKRRLFEIVIGIVAYILMYALLKWLLPGFTEA